MFRIQTVGEICAIKNPYNWQGKGHFCTRILYLVELILMLSFLLLHTEIQQHWTDTVSTRFQSRSEKKEAKTTTELIKQHMVIFLFSLRQFRPSNEGSSLYSKRGSWSMCWQDGCGAGIPKTARHQPTWPSHLSLIRTIPLGGRMANIFELLRTTQM